MPVVVVGDGWSEERHGGGGRQRKEDVTALPHRAF